VAGGDGLRRAGTSEFSAEPLPEAATKGKGRVVDFCGESHGRSSTPPSLRRSPSALKEDDNRRRSLRLKFEEEAEDFDARMMSMSTSNRQLETLRCTSLSDVVTSTSFELVSIMLVIINLLIMTVFYHLSIVDPGFSTQFFDVAELLFCVWYLVELVLRVAPFGLSAFCGPQRNWLVFDTALVLVSIPGIFLSSSSADVDSLRVTKIVKMLRLLRASRMLRLGKLMKQSVHFSLLVNILDSAAGCFLWAIFAALVVALMFSLLMLSQAAEYMTTHYLNARADFREDVLLYFGSLGRAMLTCFMSACGGIEWSTLVPMLYEIGPVGFPAFVAYILVVSFLIPNLVLALYLQTTLKTIYNNDLETLNMHMEVRDQYIGELTEVFGRGEDVAWQQFRAEESNPKLREFLSLLKIDRSQARKLFQILSGNGMHGVDLSNFVIGCINTKRAVTTMDLMEVVMMQDAIMDEQTSLVMAALNHSTTLQSMGDKCDVHDMVLDVPPELFAQELLRAVRLAGEEAHGAPPPESFLDAARRAAELALQAEGGCGILVAPQAAFAWLQEVNHVDFQVVDRSEAFPDGYMTRRLRNVHVDSEAFLQAVQELSRHSDNDRWPQGHEAAGLPKDGYILINDMGMRVLCAARIVGLPTPPYRWDGVGTRHMAAVAAAHALAEWPCAVVVRSDSGRVHGICPSQKHGSLKVVGCHLGPTG